MHTETIVKTAKSVAKKLKADAILILTETGESYSFIDGVDMPIIAATANEETFRKIDSEKKGNVHPIKLMTRGMSRAAQIEDAIVASMQKGVISDEDSTSDEPDSDFDCDHKAEC